VTATQAIGSCRILALPGSLRRASINASLLAATRGLVDGLEIEIGSIRLPLYDADLDQDGSDDVLELRSLVRSCDGLLISTPEYNLGVPGPVKNALDWLSQPPSANPMVGRPVCVIGATESRRETGNARREVQRSLRASGAHVFVDDGLALTRATRYFAAGCLVDDDVIDQLKRVLLGFAAFITEQKQQPQSTIASGPWESQRSDLDETLLTFAAHD
jgi:chromate reductase